jgi:hypothetical protein
LSAGSGAWRWHAGALAFYALLGWVLIDHGVPIAQNLSGQGSDPFDSPWFLAWWPWALTHHLDPFFTTKVWYPVGVRLNWVTSVPALALLGWPVTAFAGPVVTYNILIILAPVLSAWFAYLACFRLTPVPVAAVFGGVLFGFSAYEMAQDTAALNLCFTCCVPALLWLVLLRLQGGIGRLRFVLLAGLCLVVQFLISIEIFALIFVFGGIAWVLAALYLAERRAGLRRLFEDAAYIVPGVVLVLSPVLVSMLRHYSLVHHPEAWPYFFTADLLNVVVPSRMNALGFLFGGVSRHFNGGVQEQDAYIGVPLLLILWRFAAEAGGTLPGRLLVVLFLIFLLASFGPELWIAGHFTPIVLPWMLAVHLPLLNGALPARFALFVSLVCAIIAALWLGAAPARKGRVVLASLACLALLPRLHPWRAIPNATFFEPDRVQAALGPDPRILILPFAINGPSSFWQQENHFGFTQTGGYLGFPPAPMQRFAAVGELFGNDMTPAFSADFVAFCRAVGTQYVVVGPGANAAMVLAIKKLDWRAQKIDDVTVFTVPEPEAPEPAQHLAGGRS